VTVTTVEERASVERWCPSARGRVRVVPIGSNVAATGSRAAGWRLLRRLGAEPGDRLLVYFGWAGPGKGLPALLDATRRLWDGGWRVRLACVTAFRPRRDPFHARLAERTRALELMERVTWTGFLPEHDASSVLKAAEAVVLPFEDGARLNRGSLIAALEHGVPVVTTPGPAIRWLAPRARGRLVAVPAAPAELAAAVESLLQRPPRGPAPRWPEFSWGRIAEGIEAAWRVAVSRRRRTR
jgi:glycosyltransferase involved in cell wall biosynthesis